MQKILFSILIGLFLCGCFSNYTTQDLNYIKIEKINTKKEYQGIIKAQNSADLSFQSEGRITYLPYTKGDFVKKGTPIAKINSELYLIKKSEEQAKLQEYIIQQEKLKNNYSRLDTLHKAGAISDNDWENAYFELKTTGQQIKTQKEKINYINKELSYNTIFAPFDGYISEKFSDVDSYAKIGSPIIRLINSDGLQAEITVGQNDINNIKLNGTAIIVAQDKIYQGLITHISKSSLNSGGYLVKISIKDSTKNLKEGMSAKVNLNLQNINSFFLPLESIFEIENKTFVYKVSDMGKIQKIQVEIGNVIENKAEIISGIKQGDLIILNQDRVKQ